MIDGNKLHGSGKSIGPTGGGITLCIEKMGESAGLLKVYLYLTMDAQVNNQGGNFYVIIY